MSPRIRWEDFKGRRLLAVDASNGSRDEAWAIFEDFDALVRQQADGSVLFYFDVENAYHESKLTDQWKQAYKEHDKKVAKVAVHGAHAGLKIVFAAYRFFVRLRGVDIDMKMKFFDDPVAAKDWLVNVEGA